MTFGLTIEKLLMIAFIAAMLIGPTRLPAYATTLGRWVRQCKEFARGLSDRAREELGPDVADVDWRALDPRQYDPRRIVRQALFEEPPRSTESTDANRHVPQEKREAG
jgi:sec-independent protein translocase protein TatB